MYLWRKKGYDDPHFLTQYHLHIASPFYSRFHQNSFSHDTNLRFGVGQVGHLHFQWKWMDESESDDLHDVMPWRWRDAAWEWVDKSEFTWRSVEWKVEPFPFIHSTRNLWVEQLIVFDVWTSSEFICGSLVLSMKVIWTRYEFGTVLDYSVFLLGW